MLERFAPLLRWRYLILAAAAALVAVRAHSPATNDDWTYFMRWSRLLFGDHPAWAHEPGGLHLYANYHAQIGPLTLVLTALLRAIWGPDGSHTAAIVLLTGVGPALIFILERTAMAMGTNDAHEVASLRWTVLLGGLVFIVAWGDLTAWYVHPDDALALMFACLAMWAVAQRRPLTAGVMIGLAAAAKPWGIVVLPLVLVFGGRARVRALAGTGIVLAVTWLPFLIPDRSTLSAGAPTAPVSGRSILHLVGFTVGTTPDGIRPLQFAIALAVGVLAVRLRRWPAVLLVGVVVRVLLDPAVYGYYMAGVMVAAFAWDLLRADRPLPLATVALWCAMFMPTVTLHQDQLGAVLRLFVGVATIAVVLVAPSRSSRMPGVAGAGS